MATFVAPPCSAPLAFAHPQACIRELPRGSVKRLFARGPLIGYYVVCPSCGFPGAYPTEQAGWQEGPPVSDEALAPSGQTVSIQRAGSLASERPVECFGCRGWLRVVDGQVTVAPR